MKKMTMTLVIKHQSSRFHEHSKMITALNASLKEDES